MAAALSRVANGSSSYAGMTRFKFSGVDLSTHVHPGALRQSYGNAPNPPCGAVWTLRASARQPPAASRQPPAVAGNSGGTQQVDI